MAFASLSKDIAERIRKIMEQFDIPEGELENIEIIGNGRINRTYNVTSEQHDGTKNKYILQQVNTNIFKDPLGLMKNVVQVTEHIAAKGEKTLHMHRLKENILHTDYGYYLYFEEGEEDACWRLSDYIESEVKNSVTCLEDMYSLGEAIGEFSLNVSDFDASILTETIKDFHNTPVRVERYLKLVNSAFKSYTTAIRCESCVAENDFIMSRVSKASKIVDGLEAGYIPMRVSHNDPKLNNVLFDKETKQVMCLIDLDTIMPGSLLYDFGDAARYSCNEQKEDTKRIDKVAFNLERFEKMTEGFLKTMKDTITEAEIKLLPYSAWLMTYELALRFLDDHIRENVYFGADEDGDNLNRARVQMALLKDIEAKEEQMNEIISRVWNNI